MSDPDQMLAASRILDDLPERVAKQIERLDVVVETTSTNADLLALDPPSAGRLRVLLAEQQTAGRGRRGRQWQSPPGSGLCLSFAFRLAADDGDLGALSLVLGVASRRALVSLGVSGVGLKWPNDLIADGKLGGILVEMRGSEPAGLHVVAGIGINVDLPPSFADEMSQTANGVTDLKSLCDTVPDRNLLAAALIRCWAEALLRFVLDGSRSFVGEWTEADACRGRRAILVSDEEQIAGTCCGIDDKGRLLFDVDGAIRRVVVGDLSLRFPAAGRGQHSRGS